MRDKRDTHVNDGGSNKWYPTYSTHSQELASQSQHWINRRNGPRSDDWTTWVRNAQPNPVDVGEYQSPYKEMYYHTPESQSHAYSTQRPVSRKRNVVGEANKMQTYRYEGYRKAMNHAVGNKKRPSSFY